MRAPADRLKAVIAPASLLAGAILPALSLIYIHAEPTAFAGTSNSFSKLLLIVLPLSTFLLAIFLWQARHRILHLEAKEAEAVQTAGLDPLSGLPNRLFFERLLENATAQSTADAPISLFAIDIDKFKSVNDTHGHQAGDKLIVGVAERIKRIIRDGDCLARVGGDEFCLMLINVGNMTQCAAMAHRIHDAILAPFDIGRGQVYATLSLGIALAPQDGDNRSS
jgi:diguanylate cyclase (GGDEF) domain